MPEADLAPRFFSSTDQILGATSNDVSLFRTPIRSGAASVRQTAWDFDGGTGYFFEGVEWDRATVLRLRRVWRDFGRRFPAEGGRLSALFLGSNNRRTPTPGGCDTARVLRPRYRTLEW